MSAFAGACSAYVQGAGKPYQSMPAMSFTWDGAATPTLAVTAGGVTAATVSGQALAGEACAPQSVISAAAAAGNPWEVGAA